MDQRRTDTREQIQTIALELFAEQGYDGTSLREIAERLGMTKAAVYYHFKTKEEILTSLIEDFLDQLDELVSWGSEQPPSRQRCRAVLRRYSELLSGRTAELARFMQEGQSAIRDLAVGVEIRKRFGQLADLLTTPDQPLSTRLRARIALITLHVGTFAGAELGGSTQERRDASLQIAHELME